MTTTNLGKPSSGMLGVPTVSLGRKLTKRDFTSDQEVRWCPGCGDYSVLAAFQAFLPELGVPPENIAVVSGIGCSSRFTYYMDTYGMHSIHGRAPSIATGLAVSRPDLSVWVITGDGDALSIGGNHLIHALRRNVNIKIIMFNNRIYGLTKGQFSPTSPQGVSTKSSPNGSISAPFNPISLALACDATFVARVLDSDRAGLTEVLRAAAAHRGSAFIEVYQNCVIFNDGAYDVLKDQEEANARIIRLEHGEPLRMGNMVVVRDEVDGFEVVSGKNVDESKVMRHNAHAEDPTRAFAISRLDTTDMFCVPMGVFRDVDLPAFDDQIRAQVASAVALAGGSHSIEEINKLLRGNDTWTVD